MTIFVQMEKLQRLEGGMMGNLKSVKEVRVEKLKRTVRYCAYNETLRL